MLVLQIQGLYFEEQGIWRLDVWLQPSVPFWDKTTFKEDFCYLILIPWLGLTARETTALDEQLSWLCERKRAITEESKRICIMGHHILCSGAGKVLVIEEEPGPFVSKTKPEMSYLIWKKNEAGRHFLFHRMHRLPLIIKTLCIFYESFAKILKIMA